MESIKFNITGFATYTIGTSAQLPMKSLISVKDLLYGLMLPSGNDAAVVLAENIGVLLYY